MKIQFQADAGLDSDIGRGLVRREPSIDWRTAQGYIPDGTLDPDVLRVAADTGRLLVSRDARTLPRHFAAFIASRRSPGIYRAPTA